MSSEMSDHDYESWLRALESGDEFYLVCPNGHGWLPPRRVCKTCGSTTLHRESLPDIGTVETYTKIHISSPRFDHEDTVVVAIVDFGPVRLTGQLRNIEYEDIERGIEVRVDIERSVSTDERIIVFQL